MSPNKNETLDEPKNTDNIFSDDRKHGENTTQIINELGPQDCLLVEVEHPPFLDWRSVNTQSCDRTDQDNVDKKTVNETSSDLNGPCTSNLQKTK